jgi:hypothetical protein
MHHQASPFQTRKSDPMSGLRALASSPSNKTVPGDMCATDRPLLKLRLVPRGAQLSHSKKLLGLNALTSADHCARLPALRNVGVSPAIRVSHTRCRRSEGWAANSPCPRSSLVWIGASISALSHEPRPCAAQFKVFCSGLEFFFFCPRNRSSPAEFFVKDKLEVTVESCFGSSRHCILP